MLAEEREKATRGDEQQTRTPVAAWIHNGMSIERQKYVFVAMALPKDVILMLWRRTLVVALLKSHKDHPLEDTWETIVKIRDSLNLALRTFREQQRVIYPRLTLSALDVDEPELTAIQLPSYRMKHGQRLTTEADVTDADLKLRHTETQLRCAEADRGILAVRAASL